MLATENSNRLPAVGKQGSLASNSAARLQRLRQSVSVKLMVSIFFVLILMFGLLGYFSIRDQRKHLEDAAIPQVETIRTAATSLVRPS